MGTPNYPLDPQAGISWKLGIFWHFTKYLETRSSSDLDALASAALLCPIGVDRAHHEWVESELHRGSETDRQPQADNGTEWYAPDDSEATKEPFV
jgi:hypothetical protein